MREWLKEARLRALKTQKEAAESLGISENYYILIEQNKRQQNMDLTLAVKLADFLSVPITQIVKFETQQ